MASTLQSQHSHSLKNLTGLLTEEVGRDQEVGRIKARTEAVWFLGTEKLLCPPENGVGWGDSAEHSQRQAAHVGGGSHASAYEKNLSTLAISFLPRILEIFRFEL